LDHTEAVGNIVTHVKSGNKSSTFEFCNLSKDEAMHVVEEKEEKIWFFLNILMQYL
jgi:hypothetical protein